MKAFRHKTAESPANPLTVLRAIGADHFSSSELVEEQHADPSQLVQVAPPTDIDIMESEVESALQIQELAAKLADMEAKLTDRERELEQDLLEWKATIASQQREIDKRYEQVHQQASQVRCQQLQVMQLQTDIVRSYESAKAAIETLVVDDQTDQQMISALKTLKFEINHRFDYISRRWARLSSMLQDRIDESTAQHGNERIDWAA